MIASTVVIKIFAVLMGCWALGYGVGKSVAYTRALRNVA